MPSSLSFLHFGTRQKTLFVPAGLFRAVQHAKRPFDEGLHLVLSGVDLHRGDKGDPVADQLGESLVVREPSRENNGVHFSRGAPRGRLFP